MQVLRQRKHPEFEAKSHAAEIDFSIDYHGERDIFNSANKWFVSSLIIYLAISTS